MNSPLENFCKLYAEDKCSSGLQELFKTPAFQIPDLELPQIPESRALLHYCHALSHGQQRDALISGRYLLQALSPQLLSHGGFREQLREDLTLLQISCLEGAPLRHYLNQGGFPGASGKLQWIRNPKKLESILERKEARSCSDLAACAQSFHNAQSSLCKHYNEHITYLSHPFTPFSYPNTPEQEAYFKQELRDASEGTVVFLEPMNWDWSALCPLMDEKKLILCFWNEALLYQCLQFPSLAQRLESKRHLILLPHLYPSAQVQKQPAARNIKYSKKGTYINLTPPWLQGLCASYAQKLHNLLELGRAAWSAETKEADCSYLLGREIYFQGRAEQIGPRAFFSLHATRHNQDWGDTHKGKVPELSARYAAKWEERLEDAIARVARPTARRPLAKGPPYKIAHIMPQVVEGGHSPSKFLRMLARLHDRQRFSPHLFVTERLVHRDSEYPINSYASLSSIERGQETLSLVQQSGMPVFVENAQVDFVDTAQRLSQSLKRLEIDVAIFHGPDEINLLSARQCDCPLTVFFEHGTLPSHPGFDLVISSTKDAAQQKRAYYAAMGSHIAALPFVMNIQESWEAEAPSKEELGLPIDAQVLTTISNNLEARLNEEVLEAIAQILLRTPSAYYLPMGAVKNPEKLLKTFERLGVAKRVRFLGTQACPSQLARCMDLYINEFPFGSCIGMLEAMAAGCPPITMYDPNGPTQARYGGDYFGVDYAITSLNPADYVDLACNLLNNKPLYNKWSQRAVEIYEKRADTASYIRTLEKLVVTELESRMKQSV